MTSKGKKVGEQLVIFKIAFQSIIKVAFNRTVLVLVSRHTWDRGTHGFSGVIRSLPAQSLQHGCHFPHCPPLCSTEPNVHSVIFLIAVTGFYWFPLSCMSWPLSQINLLHGILSALCAHMHHWILKVNLVLISAPTLKRGNKHSENLMCSDLTSWSEDSGFRWRVWEL